jgi:hypothetical protein
MKYVLYLFYRYYDKGSTKQIAYEKAIFSTLALLFLNITALGNFLSLIPNHDWFSTQNRTIKYLTVFVIVIVGYFVIERACPKDKVITFGLLGNRHKLNSWLLFGYIVFSILLLIIAVNYRHQLLF